jgi:hypothetical protein
VVLEHAAIALRTLISEKRWGHSTCLVLNEFTTLQKVLRICACMQALISLNAMYDEHRANGAPIPSENEFRAYHLLTLIGTHGRYGYNSSEFQNALLVEPCCSQHNV